MLARRAKAMAALQGGRALLSSLAGGQPAADRILLRGLVFHGYHGVYPEERQLGQKFVVDATLLADLQQAGRSDDLQHTVNYAQVYEDIRGIVEGQPQQLIECVAERIAAHILGSQPRVQAVQVAVHKPQVAVAGVVQSLGVEVTRSRAQQQQQPDGT